MHYADVFVAYITTTPVFCVNCRAIIDYSFHSWPFRYLMHALLAWRWSVMEPVLQTWDIGSKLRCCTL